MSPGLLVISVELPGIDPTERLSQATASSLRYL